jgi:putative hydrolase of the HAD superfamily
MGHYIRAVLFDLGNTLMHASDAWPPVMERANMALADSLRQQGLDIHPHSFHSEFQTWLEDYYARREQDLYETTYMATLRRLLESKGCIDTPNRILRAALDELFAITQSNWKLEDDAIATLQKLERSGYRLGLISNAGDHKDVMQLADKFGIDAYFDFILTSAECSYRKPHPRIFEMALVQWSFPPEEVAMVGDTLEADIRGANEIGIFSVWITRRVRRPAPGEEAIQPDASVGTLGQIPETLAKVQP